MIDHESEKPQFLCPDTIEWMTSMDSLYDILGETARRADAPGPEILTKQTFAAATVETLIALKR